MPRPLQAPKVSGIFPEKIRKNSGKFPTFYFSGKVTTMVAAVLSCCCYSVVAIVAVVAVVVVACRH